MPNQAVRGAFISRGICQRSIFLFLVRVFLRARIIRGGMSIHGIKRDVGFGGFHADLCIYSASMSYTFPNNPVSPNVPAMGDQSFIS